MPHPYPHPTSSAQLAFNVSDDPQSLFNIDRRLYLQASEADQNNNIPQPQSYIHSEQAQGPYDERWLDSLYVPFNTADGVAAPNAYETTHVQGFAPADTQALFTHPAMPGSNGETFHQQWAPFNAPNHNPSGGNVGHGAFGGNCVVEQFWAYLQSQPLRPQDMDVNGMLLLGPTGSLTPMSMPSMTDAETHSPPSGLDTPPNALSPQARALRIDYERRFGYGQHVLAQEPVVTASQYGVPPFQVGAAPPLVDPAYLGAHGEIMADFDWSANMHGIGGVQYPAPSSQNWQHTSYTTTSQGIATGAALNNDNVISTDPTRAGGARTKGAGSQASSRSRTVNAVAGPSRKRRSARTQDPYKDIEVREEHPLWHSAEKEEKMGADKKDALTEMFHNYRRKLAKVCLFPGCKDGGKSLASYQSFERHVRRAHLKNWQTAVCPICGEKYSCKEAVVAHMKRTDGQDGCKGSRTGKKGNRSKGKGKQT
ncbi:unnamed protein product [Peniophora sp. CBMAI 1063]|nr:unnamed protein product [Peniophora sp. CBMAI 1063]